MKIYGPYTNNKNRQFIIKVINNKRKTQSYPRYLMEQFLGRSLTSDEEIDHIDNNHLNNDLTNLQILSKQDNRLKEMTQEHRKRKQYTFICPNCQKEAIKPLNFVKHNKNKGKTGPFCSRKCAGQYTYKSPWK